MKIYDIDFSIGLFLAPLSGYTNWPLRVLCRRYGAELAYTEMISSTGLLRREKSSMRILERPPEDRPLIAQIFSSNPQESALAARFLQHEGFDGIDINMGCPAKKVVSKGSGAALMKDVAQAQAMVEAVVEAVNLPVSVKMRAGWDPSCLNADHLARLLVEKGAGCIIIHPRARSDLYQGLPQWEVLERLRRAVDVPIIASGNIATRPDLEQIKALGADAFLIGRAAIGRPWIFRELTGGDPPALSERRDVMLEHLDMLCTFFGEDKGVRSMRKFLSAYVRGLPGAARFRDTVCTLEETRALELHINAFFAELPD